VKPPPARVNAMSPTIVQTVSEICRSTTGGIMLKPTSVACLLVIAALSTVSAAQAEEKEGAGACRADVQKLCKGVQPGGGRIAVCLKQHESEISPGCRENIAKAREEVKEIADACKADAETLCKGVRPGQGRILHCLDEHKDKVSSACSAKMAEAQSRHPCVADMQRLCKDVQPGQGRMMECMKKHEAELSAECKAHHAQQTGGAKQ
jgi:Cysteine rich repeat